MMVMMVTMMTMTTTMMMMINIDLHRLSFVDHKSSITTAGGQRGHAARLPGGQEGGGGRCWGRILVEIEGRGGAGRGGAGLGGFEGGLRRPPARPPALPPSLHPTPRRPICLSPR